MTATAKEGLDEKLARVALALVGPALHGVRRDCLACRTASIIRECKSEPAVGKVNDLPIRSIEWGRCTACEALHVAVQMQKDNGNRSLLLLWPDAIRPSRAPAGLDEGAKRDYDEARATLSRSSQAAAVLARRCLQHVIRKKLEITKKRLFDEISEALKCDALSQPTKKGLDHIRQLGNYGAHPVDSSAEPDEAATLIRVSPEEAVYTIEILEMLFDDLYEKPAKIEAMETALKAKGKTSGADSINPA